MNHAQRLLFALTLTASAASVFATEAEQWNPPAGHATRAQVQRDLTAAEASGEMTERNEAYGNIEELPAGTMSRAQVRTELRQAEASGEMNDRNEAYGGVEVPSPGHLDRRMVQAEGTRAMHERVSSAMYVGD